MSLTKKQSRFSLSIAAALAIGAGVLLGGAPASAAEQPTTTADQANIMAEEPAQGFAACPNGSVCIWKDAWFATNDYRLSFVSFARYITDYRGFNYRNTSINSANTATSILNDGLSETAHMYASTNKRTKLFTLPRGNYNLSLAGAHGDNIESGYYNSFN